MTNPLDQLNLRPQEKRILVVVGFMIFVVLNFWFVRPLFGQFGKLQADLEKSRRTLAKYQDEIAKTSNYQRLEEQLKKSGSDVLSEELQLQRLVDNQARSSSVMVSRYAPGVRTASGRTNQFFEDQGLTIDFTSPSTNLVEFLVGLASGNSMIRVQDMTLRPDGTGTKLTGNILFVASYQKKPPAAKPAGGAAVKTAATSPVKTTPPAAGTKTPATTGATNKNKAATTAKPATNQVKSAATNTAKSRK